jgi:superfamily II DNA or RNA helicase
MHQDQLYKRLAYLEEQKFTIEKEIMSIKHEIEKQSPFSKADKITLFHKLFIGNELAYAKHWISKDGLKKGYAPVSRTFRGSDYITVNDFVIQQHLEGKIRMGTYAVKNQSMCSFLAIDLDKSSFIADARAINEVSKSMAIVPYFELSKSGNGIHIWFFFFEDVRARDARILGDLLITRAMDISDGINMGSYDRLFPNQDYVAADALGNLIALPLHFGSRSEGKTVFIDIETMQPYIEQWVILKSVQKIPSSKLQGLITDYAKFTELTSLMPWEIKQEKLLLPKSIHMILHNAIYIEKEMLSKTLLNLLKRMASFYNPEFFMRQRQRLSTFNTPRVVSTYDINERYIILPRGLYAKLKSFFKKHKVHISMEDKRLKVKTPKQDFFLTLRDEQEKSKNKILRNDYALLIAPPGFGKTAVAASVISERRVATLILVHKTVLLEQWSKRLSEYYKIDIKSIGILGKGKKKLNGELDVATLQSLKNRPELIENYSQIIIDEAHHMPAVSFEIPLKRFKGKYVLGLSATPKRKDGMEAIMYLQCGDIVHESVRKNTIKHILKTIATQYETFSDHFTMMLGEITEDEIRNRQIINEILKLPDRKILVLSERIEHLNILWHMLEAKGVEAVLLYGGLKTKEKKIQFEKTENASIILSTSSYIGEGIDIGHLDTIVFTMPISYPERIIQYLGRIGREGQKCLAIDFVDTSVPMLKSSFNKRIKGYKKMGYVFAPKQSLFEIN